MVNSRQKGAVGEQALQKVLIAATGLPFERTPGSGCGAIKGDLHVLGARNAFCIEVKNYADSHFNDKILTSKSNVWLGWWQKLLVQSKQCKQKPLLIWKYNRSKWFVSTSDCPTNTNKFVDTRWLNCYTLLLDDWLSQEYVQWIK